MLNLTRRALLASSAAFLAAHPARAAAPRRLTAGSRVIEVGGRAATVWGIAGPAGPGLTLEHGEPFHVELVNGLAEPTLIHWHGLTPPSDQDGVPMLSQAPIRPGERHVYDFASLRSGTHWMHSHVGLQEQLLLAAPLIVREVDDGAAAIREHTVILHDFTFRDPQAILAELKAGGGGHAAHAGMDHSAMPAAMLNDVVYDAYLANDRTLDDPEVLRLEPGETLRLRVINAASASNMWIDLGALEADLIAVDGNRVKPVRASRFPLAVAQRADLLIALPSGGGAYPVLFRPEGVTRQTGLILAGKSAAVRKIAGLAPAAAPALDLAFEARLEALVPLPPAEGKRSELLHLGGGEADYLWTLNGRSGMHETVLTVRPGERIEVALMNMTGMAHPMHLHGHHFQVVGLSGRRISGAMRDTVLVPPMQTVAIAFDADNPGAWAFHCHHIYHMNSGMMGALTYIRPA